MPLPASGQISFSQLAAELGNASTNIGLRAYSACANLSSPDSITELWGKACFPIFGGGVWSTAGAISGHNNNTGTCHRVAGTQCAAIINVWNFPPTAYTSVRHFNNGVHSAGTDITTNGTNTVTGTQNAALSMGSAVRVYYESGVNPYTGEEAPYYIDAGQNCVHKYNGVSWSAASGIPLAMRHAIAVGTQNSAMVSAAAVYFASGVNEFSANQCTFNYNGTSWSNGPNHPEIKAVYMAAGTQNASFAAGGQYTGTCRTTHNYNGASWSASGLLITQGSSGGAFGTQNAGVVAGTNFGPTATEEYNGATWATGGAFSGYPRTMAGTHNAGIALNNGSYTGLYNKAVIGKCLV